MGHGLTKVAGIVLAALAAVAAWLLGFATPVVVAIGYPVMHRPVPTAPLSTNGLVVIILVAIAVALGALVYVGSLHPRSEAQVRKLAVRHEHEQKHEQMPKAA
jgi:hypothetical protein